MSQGWSSNLKKLFGASPSDVSMRRDHVQCLSSSQLHRMSYVEWGDPTNPRVLICVHGLTRNARDFDDLARALASEYRVVCPDIAGRGQSDWLSNKADYVVPVYMQHMVTLIARLGVSQVDWLGTSLGGLIGMGLASLEHSPIRSLFINDIGPVLLGPVVAQICESVGKAPTFANLAHATEYIRQVGYGFGKLSAEQWHHLSVHSVDQEEEGWKMVYDPAIGETLRAMSLENNIDLWSLYDAIHCPTAVMRGAESDLLPRVVADEMTRRGPRARLFEIPEVGHAPTLMDPAQIRVVKEFLLGRSGH